MFRAFPLLFAALVLAGCAQRAHGAGGGAAPIVSEAGTTAGGATNPGAADKVADATGVPRAASIAVAPAYGYAGTFVGVTGTGWPPSAMILVKLADAQGRSPVLAAVAADAKGQFTTGFVYPAGERWLHPGPVTVVAQTENGQVEITAAFAVAPPADVVPPTATPIAVSTATPSVAAIIVATPAVTPTIPFTSGALAATVAPTAVPTAAPTIASTATPVPTATATPLPPATSMPTAQPAAEAASTATSPATAAPQASSSAYRGPVSTIDELIAAISRMPPGELAPELANSLVQKLNNAQKQVDKGHATPASNMLRAFQHEVAAQWGKKIDDASATFLTASADNVIAHLQQRQPAGNGADSSDDDHGNGKGNGKGKGDGEGNDKGKSHGNGNGNGNSGGKGNGKGQ